MTIDDWIQTAIVLGYNVIIDLVQHPMKGSTFLRVKGQRVRGARERVLLPLR